MDRIIAKEIQREYCRVPHVILLGNAIYGRSGVSTKKELSMRIFILSILFIVAFPEIATAADELTCSGMLRSEYVSSGSNGSNSFDPPPGSGATQIDVGFHLTSLSDIDVIGSRFRFEGYAEFAWCDPRQAFDASTEGRTERVLFGETAHDSNGDLWIPDIELANSIGEVATTARRTEISADGTVRLSGFFNSVVATRFDLRRFPFDQQSFAIAMESFTFNRDVVSLRPMENMVGYEENLYLPEWRVKGLTASTEDAGQVRDRVPFSQMIINVNVEREAGYYLVKLSVPLTLIVMLSWSVFWMGKESLGGRMRISSTAFLTIVAYQFAISGSLPKVAYLTLMDKVMIAAFILIALSALENMVAVTMSERNPEGARKLDRRSRWMFPITYVTMIATVALVGGQAQ
jgi:hypothetical protein